MNQNVNLNLLRPSQRAAIELFMEITNASKELALMSLQNSDWNINDAKYLCDQYKKSKESWARDLENLYRVYRDPDEDKITQVGIQLLLQALNIKADSLQALIFFWKCNARKATELTRDEFIKGMKKINVNCLTNLKANLHQLELQFTDEEQLEQFEQFYKFLYIFINGVEKIHMDTEVAISCWRTVLIGRFKLMNVWCTFLRENDDIKISKDIWNMLLEFIIHIIDIDINMGNYNPDDAWPTCLDEFVEWYRGKYVKK